MTAFRTTLWHRLDQAAAGRETALNEFAQRYRQPVITFLRGRGLPQADAEDVAQDVFVRILSQNLLARGDASKGRFRSYLLGITLHVLNEGRRRDRRVKRGGNLPAPVPLHLAPPPAAVAEFEGFWLRDLVARSLASVQQANPTQHALLCASGEGASPDAVAAQLGLSPGAARVALHRARKTLAATLKEEIAAYCSSEEEFAAELRAFSQFLG